MVGNPNRKILFDQIDLQDMNGETRVCRYRFHRPHVTPVTLNSFPNGSVPDSLGGRSTNSLEGQY